MNNVLESNIGIAFRKRLDIFDCGVFIFSFLWIYYLSSILSPRLFGIGLDDFWFDADVPRYICQAVDRFANDHWRNKVHPLFSLITYPFPNLLKILGVEILQAIRIQCSLVVAVGSLFMFKAMRNLDISRINALLIIALGLSGAASLVWFSIPESYAYSFAAFSMVLFTTTLNQEKPGITIRWISAIAIAFSITVTNIAVAGWSAIQSCGVRRAFFFSVMAISAVLILAVVQRLLFPFSGIFFLPSAMQGESSFFVSISPERIRQVLALFFFGSLVFPEFQLINISGAQPSLTVQQAVWKSESLLSVAAIVLLSIFVLAGLLALFAAARGYMKNRGRAVQAPFVQTGIERMSATVIGAGIFLILLHMIYGTETFVYSGSFLPFLLIIVGLGANRLAAISKAFSAGLLLVLLITNSVHGLRQWHAAVAEVRSQAALVPSKQAMARNTCPFVKRQELF